MRILSLIIILPLIFISCQQKKSESKTDFNLNTLGKDSLLDKPKPISKVTLSNLDCYDLLLEVILHSSFNIPDEIKKERVSILIDTHDDKTILAKVFFETEGTGTLGWIRYDFESQKLFDVSAYLENPEELNLESSVVDLINRKCFSSDTINNNIANVKEINQSNCYQLTDEENYLFTDLCLFPNSISIHEIYKRLLEKQSTKHLLSKIPTQDTSYIIEKSNAQIDYEIPTNLNDSLKINMRFTGGETYISIFPKNDSLALSITSSPD
ncbi:hypothetical protein LVD15_11235 [Fulvivirga maritima]|uniref:hypothetical protein n=1 Tax=Fulvivirga maritima TaxID=2904247 RepID=UPI001F3C43A3|nr:hypothetical protein [Fulvivirga maritima]UII28970.1 hypothetical protein LVD15_11235 [Fulvivirga maritima]